jgi:predicted  nucleic acid-binding Zn-ribbon protein
MALLTGNAPELHEAGEGVGGLPSVGCLTCTECGYAVSLGAIEDERLPRCPACGGSQFKRASLFEQPTVDATAVTPPEAEPLWLERARAQLEEPGPHLAFDYGGRQVVVPIEEGWMRIGRSRAADVRLDDPTVSRRHALIVLTDERELRALDDRSLNGLFVNGEQVEWARLSDGDELEIGRYQLHVIDP